ncbi:MAG: MFS transporter, partial [Candidatus Bathyarchaeota archaeon]
MFAATRNRALLKIFYVTLFVMLTDNMTGAILIPFAIELKSDILQVNLITTISSTMYIALEVPFGILSDRYGRRLMLIYTRALVIVGQLLRVLATEPSHLIASALLGGFSGGDFFPIILSMI